MTAQRSMTDMFASSWRSPVAGVSSLSRSICSALSSMPSAAVFSSTRETRLVPGLGAMSSPCASSQANATCADVASTSEATARTRPLRPRTLRPRRRALHPKQRVPHALGRAQLRFHITGVKNFHHPVVGDLSLTYDCMELPADPGLTIFTYTAEPGSRSEQALNLLASWAATHDQPATAPATGEA